MKNKKYICLFILFIALNIINIKLAFPKKFTSNVIQSNDTLSITDIDFSDNKVYLCVNFKEIFVSSDYGDSWSKLNFPFSRENNYSISQLEIYEKIILAYHMDGTLLISTDVGKCWMIDSFFKDLNIANNNDVEKNIWINNVRIINNTIYVCTNKGLYHKNHKNNCWETYPSLPAVNLFDIQFINNVYYFLSEIGLFLYSKIDKKIDEISTFRIYDGKNVYSLLVNNNILYVSADSGVFCSTNSGIKWSNITKNLDIPEAEFDDVLTLFSFKNKIYIKSVNGLYIYNDLSEFWDKIYFKRLLENYREYWSTSSSAKYLFLGSQSGDLYSSTDGLNFIPIEIHLSY